MKRCEKINLIKFKKNYLKSRKFIIEKAFACNTFNILRAVELMNPDMPESRDLFRELNLGVGALSPGHFIDLYGSEDWPGAMFQELRDWCIVEARETGNHQEAENTINDYQANPPNSRDNNQARARKNWERQEQIYRFNVEHYKAVQKTSMFGLNNLTEVKDKFPGTLTDVELPIVTTWAKRVSQGK